MEPTQDKIDQFLLMKIARKKDVVEIHGYNDIQTNAVSYNDTDNIHPPKLFIW